MMTPRPVVWRRASDRVFKCVACLAALLGIVALASIVCEVSLRGLSAWNWNFFTMRSKGPGAGVANSILGTLLMTSLATLIGVPLGVLAGVYLAEFGRSSRLAGAVRFATNVLMGTPSILLGVFVYTVLVATTGHFSGYAGAVALALIMLPVVARTSEDMLNLVPDALRESALALGAPRWKCTVDVVFRSAKSGLLTGIILAIARASGETAPLLFTALNSNYWPRSLGQPTSNLTVTIFNMAADPRAEANRMAWGASLLITLGVLSLMLVARFIIRDKSHDRV